MAAAPAVAVPVVAAGGRAAAAKSRYATDKQRKKDMFTEYAKLPDNTVFAKCSRSESFDTERGVIYQQFLVNIRKPNPSYSLQAAEGLVYPLGNEMAQSISEGDALWRKKRGRLTTTPIPGTSRRQVGGEGIGTWNGIGASEIEDYEFAGISGGTLDSEQILKTGDLEMIPWKVAAGLTTVNGGCDEPIAFKDRLKALPPAAIWSNGNGTGVSRIVRPAHSYPEDKGAEIYRTRYVRVAPYDFLTAVQSISQRARRAKDFNIELVEKMAGTDPAKPGAPSKVSKDLGKTHPTIYQYVKLCGLAHETNNVHATLHRDLYTTFRGVMKEHSDGPGRNTMPATFIRNPGQEVFVKILSLLYRHDANDVIFALGIHGLPTFSDFLSDGGYDRIDAQIREIKTNKIYQSVFNVQSPNRTITNEQKMKENIIKNQGILHLALFIAKVSAKLIEFTAHGADMMAQSSAEKGHPFPATY